jgi:hypothetical protein
MTSKKHLSTLQERQKESKICSMKGAQAIQTLQMTGKQEKCKDKDMVEVCRYKVCWLGNKGKKIPYVDGMKFKCKVS